MFSTALVEKTIPSALVAEAMTVPKLVTVQIVLESPLMPNDPAPVTVTPASTVSGL